MYCNRISTYTGSFTLKYPSQLLHVRIHRSRRVNQPGQSHRACGRSDQLLDFFHHILSFLVRRKGEERKDREEMISSTDASWTLLHKALSDNSNWAWGWNSGKRDTSWNKASTLSGRDLREASRWERSWNYWLTGDTCITKEADLLGSPFCPAVRTLAADWRRYWCQNWELL